MTPDETALIRAVFDRPDDDTPRLVYADWCDDNGQPERAAFIRRDVERHRGGNEDHAMVCAWRKHGPADVWYWGCAGRSVYWRKGEIRAVCSSLPVPTDGDCRASFVRGFCDWIALPVLDWLTHADAILAAHPVRRVRLTDGPTRREADGSVAMLGTAGVVTDRWLAARWPGVAFELPDALSPLAEESQRRARRTALPGVAGVELEITVRRPPMLRDGTPAGVPSAEIVGEGFLRDRISIGVLIGPLQARDPHNGRVYQVSRAVVTEARDNWATGVTRIHAQVMGEFTPVMV